MKFGAHKYSVHSTWEGSVGMRHESVALRVYVSCCISGIPEKAGLNEAGAVAGEPDDED